MHIRAQRFQLFLMGDTKALFFINHQQTEISEFHFIGQQRMGTNDNINLALLQAIAGVVRVFLADQTG